MIPTKDELITIVCDRLGMFSNDAVEDLADELIRRWNVSQNNGKPIVSGALPSDDMINEAADKYGFRVPYDGSNKFYDDDAIKHFLAGVSWYRSALVGNDR